MYGNYKLDPVESEAVHELLHLVNTKDGFLELMDKAITSMARSKEIPMEKATQFKLNMAVLKAVHNKFNDQFGARELQVKPLENKARELDTQKVQD